MRVYLVNDAVQPIFRTECQQFLHLLGRIHVAERVAWVAEENGADGDSFALGTLCRWQSDAPATPVAFHVAAEANGWKRAGTEGKAQDGRVQRVVRVFQRRLDLRGRC